MKSIFHYLFLHNNEQNLLQYRKTDAPRRDAVGTVAPSIEQVLREKRLKHFLALNLAQLILEKGQHFSLMFASNHWKLRWRDSKCSILVINLVKWCFENKSMKLFLSCMEMMIDPDSHIRLWGTCFYSSSTIVSFILLILKKLSDIVL